MRASPTIRNDEEESRTGFPFGRASRPAPPALTVESGVGPGRRPGRWDGPRIRSDSATVSSGCLARVAAGLLGCWVAAAAGAEETVWLDFETRGLAADRRAFCAAAYGAPAAPP
jgi:hypothetical protein